MAVIDKLPGVEVTITVDGQPLQEYEEPEAEEEYLDTVTRYIAVKSAQTFEVCIKVARDAEFLGDMLVFHIYADGKWADGPIVTKEDVEQGAYTEVSRGREGSNNNVFLYCFNDVELAADGKMFDHEAKVAKSLGTVRIDASHQIMTSRAPKRPTDFKEMGIISEKMLAGRAITQSVSFKETSQPDDREDWDGSFVFPENPTAASFAFRYRSADGLKAEMIIPRTPSPPPLEERDIDSLSREEMKELVRRMKERDTVVKREIKREVKDEDNHATQPPPRKKHRPHAGDTQLELGEDGRVRQTSTADLPEREIIELD